MRLLTGVGAMLGLFVVIGAAGAADNGCITTQRMVIQSIIGLVMFFVSAVGCIYLEDRDKYGCDDNEEDD